LEVSTQFIDALSHSHQTDSGAVSGFTKALDALFRYASAVVSDFKNEVS
jgi:hypothetical protein